MALRSLSLCSGIGGLDRGLARWCRTVCYVERDAFAASVLVARMEDEALDRAPVWDDLRSFDGRAWRGTVDIVVGGYPCQPFSHAGKRLGDRDERHLWPEIRRILDECGAPLAFFENVRGHLSLGFADVLADLARLGFDAEWTVLGADEVGAPHRRDRLFVLAHAMRTRGSEESRSTPSDEGQNEGRVTQDDHQPYRGGEGLAYARSDGLRRREEHDGHALQDPAEWTTGPPEPMRCGEHVGDAKRTRRPASRSGHSFDAGSQPFPPGPQDQDGWRDWIEWGGPQPVLRRGTDGPAAFVDRADRLRCLGNAVVPAQASSAFDQLARRIPWLTELSS